MKMFIKIFARLCFIGVWFAFGYFLGVGVDSGICFAICSFCLMEICYYIDKKTSGYNKVLGRLDFIEETIKGAQDTKNLILTDLMVAADNITDNGDFSKGEKAGLKRAQKIAVKRFDSVFDKLATEKSQFK